MKYGTSSLGHFLPFLARELKGRPAVTFFCGYRTFHYTYRDLYLLVQKVSVFLLEKGVRQEDIAKQMRIFGDRKNFFAQLHNVTLRQIGENLQRLADIDYAIKTGRTKPQTAMEQLVLELAAG